MNILFLSDNFPPERNAPASRTYEHARQWVNAGEQVTVVTCVPNFPEGKIHQGYRNLPRQVETIDGIRVVRVCTYVTANEGLVRRSLDYASFMLSGSLAALAEKRPDVIVATSPHFFAALAGWIVARSRRTPLVLEIRDLWPESIRAVGAMRDGAVLRTLSKVERFLYRKADHIVTVTEAFRRHIASRGIPAGKISVVPNGIDGSLFWPRQPDEALRRALYLDGHFLVSYVGTHGMAHGLDTVLEAARLLQDEAVRFLLLGSGAEKERLKRIASEQGLRNVMFLDPRPRTEMPAFWSISDATVVPLRRDPLFRTTVPSKIFEAMGMGVPILLGVEGEAKDLVDEAGAGIAFPPEDAEALASSVRKLMQEPPLRRLLRDRALASAKRYSRDLSAAQMLDILRTAAGVPVCESSCSGRAGAKA